MRGGSILLLGALLLASCAAPRVTTVERREPPALVEAGLKPLPERHPDRVWVPQEAVRSGVEADREFARAREAYWDRRTGEAVAGFERLLGSGWDRIPRAGLCGLILQCHEDDRDWAGVEACHARLGLEATHGERLRFMRRMAAWRAPAMEWAGPVAEMPIELRRGQLVTVPGRIHGRDVRLLVDTGFSWSFVVEDLARGAGVEITEETIALSDANNRESAGRLGRLDLLELGGLAVRDLPVVTAPPRLLHRIAGPVDGVVGWDLLRELVVEWDFPAKRMTLRPAASGDAPGVGRDGAVEGAGLRMSGRRMPILTVTGSSGQPLNLFLDTGLASGRLHLHRNGQLLASRLPLGGFGLGWRPRFSFGMHSLGISWPRRARPFDFYAGGYRFRTPGADLGRGGEVREGMSVVDGVVGNGPFLSGRLTLDASRRRCAWEPSGMAE